jgi:hypothetical protein
MSSSPLRTDEYCIESSHPSDVHGSHFYVILSIVGGIFDRYFSGASYNK